MTMHFYPHHVGDYRAATAHLSNEEDICYRRLLDRYYDTELPIPDDLRLMARQCRVSEQVVKDVLNDFFTLIDGHWHNTRADAEIAKWYSKCLLAKKAIETRWAKRKSDTDVLRTNIEGNTQRYRVDTTQDPRPNTQELNTSGTNVPDSVRPVGQPPSGSKQLPCPHKKILALWAEVLPAMPQHTVWNATRADHLQARWREVAVQKKWTTEEQGIEFFRKMFVYVGKSPFLTGQTKAKDRPFIVELEWLIKPNNWAKVIEGKYHQQQEA